MADASDMLKMWEKFSAFPGGKMLFSKFIGKMIPYTGSVHPEVLEISPGKSHVMMKDRKKVRNHLRCIHAIAQTNLAEFTTGLAMLSGIPENTRGIITGLSIEFKKKARGNIHARCEVEPPKSSEKTETDVSVELTDESGDVVSTAKVKWLISPKT